MLAHRMLVRNAWSGRVEGDFEFFAYIGFHEVPQRDKLFRGQVVGVNEGLIAAFGVALVIIGGGPIVDFNAV